MAYIHVRTDGNLKNRVQKILKKMGLDMSTAVNLYLVKIDLTKDIPFKVSADNGEKKKDIVFKHYPLPGDPCVKKPTKDVPLGLFRGEIDADAFLEPL